MIPAHVRLTQRGTRPRWVVSVEWQNENDCRALVALDSERRRLELGRVPDSAIVGATARSPLRIEIDWMAIDAAYTSMRLGPGVPPSCPTG